MELSDLVREEYDTKNWEGDPNLVERVLVRLNNLHRVAVQEVLALETQIRGAGGEPLVKVSIVWPKPPPQPEPGEVLP